MAKRYDPILCMMVDEPTKAQDAKKEEGFKILSAIIKGEKLVLTFEDLLNSPGKKETMEFTKKEAEAFKKDPWNTWTGNTKSIVEKFIGSKVHDSASALDKAIRICDASTGHKVVVFVENYLRSIGKNNSTGKYDKIVQGVRSLLSQSLLDDDGLKKAAEHEADRLLKKYNL